MSGYPCNKCGKPTNHATGLCKDCRTVKCECGRVIAMKNKKCSECMSKQRKFKGVMW